MAAPELPGLKSAKPPQPGGSVGGVRGAFIPAVVRSLKAARKPLGSAERLKVEASVERRFPLLSRTLRVTVKLPLLPVNCEVVTVMGVITLVPALKFIGEPGLTISWVTPSLSVRMACVWRLELLAPRLATTVEKS